ncbi:MAG: ubiquinone biosynthesis protein UbiE [Methanomicrobiales archaeon HGW-Methanomicrobiales-1]|jgi:ubiquinone/menaquinone biosynthesis C-methylase UbiE|nr:MAG: ubiquinone biosynthesis protein UbiE [Methanomicrobiales archaeon HGW-Methanomicrobiales-1]
MSATRHDKIQLHYDSIADVYDHHYDHHRGRRYHTHISSQLMRPLPRGGRLLDIGCGTGLFVEKFIKNGGTAVGLDISGKMISRAHHRCPTSEFILGTGEKIPFCDDSFEAVASLLAFSYVKDPQAMLSESLRVLKPGGTISICTLGKKLLTRGIPAIYQIGEMMKIKHVVMKNFGEHYYDKNEMTALFTEAGFSDVEVSWCSFAHIDMIDPLFNFAQKVEPFVEKRVPQLAYNICVSGRKPQ